MLIRRPTSAHSTTLTRDPINARPISILPGQNLGQNTLSHHQKWRNPLVIWMIRARREFLLFSRQGLSVGWLARRGREMLQPNQRSTLESEMIGLGRPGSEPADIKPMLGHRNQRSLERTRLCLKIPC